MPEFTGTMHLQHARMDQGRDASAQLRANSRMARGAARSADQTGAPWLKLKLYIDVLCIFNPYPRHVMEFLLSSAAMQYHSISL